MKTLKLINNRLSWLSAGIYLGIFIIAWIMDDEDKKKSDLSKTDIYNNYNNLSPRDKFEAYKENTNA